MTISDAQVNAGQAIYSPLALRFYDLVALGFSGRFIWRCSKQHLLDLYDQHVTANHLDVGVGTGYFLDRCGWPTKRPRIALMDLNPNCLEAAGRRLSRYKPEQYRANVLKPIPHAIQKFDSISLTWLLHCVPGTIQDKASVFHHLKPLLNPDGVIFGATLLNEGIRHNWMSKRLMALYNSKGIFSTQHDDLDGLHTVLASNLKNVKVEIVGCGALFSGHV